MSKMAENPQISVIIPAYNGSLYIRPAIASVLHQTYRDWELIVVDDGSTDNTRQIVQQYEDKLRYLYQENQGVAAARNRGILEAKGELIAFLDQDDFFCLTSWRYRWLGFKNTPVSELSIVFGGLSINKVKPFPIYNRGRAYPN